MSDAVLWVNGRLLGADEPAVGVLDHGLTVGDGAFETAKIEAGRVFALQRHHERLDRSLAGLGLPPAPRDLVEAGISATVAGIEFGRVRWTVTSGAGPMGSDRGDGPATVIVTAIAMERPPASAALATVEWTRNERAATVGLKTTSYADNVIALAAAKRVGASEAILANTRGELCEGTGSNVFVVLDGVICTPPLSSGALGGITRQLVLEWCAADGIPVEERDMPLSVLGTAEEVFITSSTRDVQAIHAVDGRELPVGPLTTAAAESFRRHSEAGDE